jgi:proton-translocating NADH-quinone oxidoreductase chain N
LIDLLIIFPELFLFNAAIFLLVYGVIYQSERQSTLISICTLSLCSLFLTFLLLFNQPISLGTFFYHSWITDSFTSFLKVIVLSSSFLVITMSLTYVKEIQIYTFETLILILLCVATMMFLISSYDLLPLYLAIELQSLCFYVLAASKRNSEFSTEAGLKYFLLGAFSSGILLFGFSLIYGFTGMTNFEDLSKFCFESQIPSSSYTSYSFFFEESFYMPISMTIGMIFIAVGFLFKMTAVPFHMWAPDVYEGSPTYITAFFAIVPKIAILGVFLRMFQWSFHGFFQQWDTVFILSCLGSMILGAIAAMSQQKFKRLLAYSSIGHVGFMLVGLCCGTIEGIQALLIYIVIYMIMSCGLFATALSLYSSHKFPKKNISFIESITDFNLLGKTNPILALTLTVILFSMAGIPPLAGFCSKFYLFFAALSSSLYLVSFVGVITSVISCFYYIRFIKIMYFENKLEAAVRYLPISFNNSLIIALVGIFLVFFFIYPSPLFLWTHKIAIALCF